ncbi:MAG: DUF504 domain-containing protein [Methanomassiliicoccales archaeon]
MLFPREILNELKWRSDRLLESARITLEHRGAPGDIRVINGDEITELDRSFFSTGEARIPYHRILRIERVGPSGEVEESWDFL